MITILNEQIRDGSKFIRNYEISDENGVTTIIPYYVICGKNPGPVLCVTSGVHGTEYPGIGANLQLYHDIQPENLSGTLIGVPQCNFASFTTRVPFVNPLDNKNLNDTFPGNENGSITEKICHVLVKEFAAKADFHIDMHSGDSIEFLHPYAFYHINQKDSHVTSISREMAQVYALDYVAHTETDGLGATDKGNFYASVCELGIPSIQPEIGGIGLIQEHTKQLHYNGVLNVMNYLGMLKGTITVNTQQCELSRFYRLKSSQNGVYHCLVSPGEKVKKSQKLAYVTDYHGETVYEEFFAEEDSVILWVMAPFATIKGDNLMAIGII